MKTVIIKEIRLLNFKGLRNLTVEFDPALTEIYGRNGIGKTGKHGKIDPVGTDEIDPVKTA